VKILEETVARVDKSQTLDYIPNGRHKALAPADWMDFRVPGRGMLAQERVKALSWV
jgi:hypothetical protein